MFRKTVKNSMLLLLGLVLAGASSIVRAEVKSPKVATEIAATAVPLNAADEDTILRQAKKVKNDLEIWPVRVQEKLAQVKESLDSLDLQEIKMQRGAVNDFEELLEVVDTEAEAIEDAWGSVKGELALWRDAVTKAPDSFRALASV